MRIESDSDETGCYRTLFSLIPVAGSCLACIAYLACGVLAEKGGLHEHDRRRVKTGTGY